MPHFTEKGTVVIKAVELLHTDKHSAAVAFPGGVMHSFNINEITIVYDDDSGLRIEMPVGEARRRFLL